MKKVLKLLSILLLITLTFLGCSSSDESNSKKVANQFENSLYTVDSKQVSDYNDTLSNTQDFKKIADTIQSLHKNIKPLMTDKGYANLFANRMYFINLNACAKNDCTMKITSLTLSNAFYDSKGNAAGYDYEAKFKLISNKDKKEQTDVAKGYIGLSKENGQWKVDSYKLTTAPKSLMGK